MGLGSGADVKMAMLGVKTEVATVAAGPVTLEATNASKDMAHGMILSPAPANGKLRPCLAVQCKVDEDAAGHLGHVSELDRARKGTLTLDLEPGRCILICDIPAHFRTGMWGRITVG